MLELLSDAKSRSNITYWILVGYGNLVLAHQSFGSHIVVTEMPLTDERFTPSWIRIVDRNRELLYRVANFGKLRAYEIEGDNYWATLEGAKLFTLER